MDKGSTWAVLAVTAGAALVAGARLFAMLRGSDRSTDLSLPGLGLALDQGDGVMTLSAPNPGRTHVLEALNLPHTADAQTVRRVLDGLTLEGGRSGGDALRVLEHKGIAFSATALAPSGSLIRLEGFLNNQHPTVWVLAFDAPISKRSSVALVDMLDRLPVPAMRMNAEGRPVWANHAALNAIEASSPDDMVARQLSFGRDVSELAQRALTERQRLEARTYIPLAGQRRFCRVDAFPSGDGVAVILFDETDAEAAREALSRHTEAHDQTLDHLADGVAIFGRDKRLMFFNRAFAELWSLEVAWLSDRPSHSEILDRLRERRRLPEVADFAGWKQRELGFYESLKDVPDELWSLPNERTLRVFRQPHPMGGLLLLFEDMTNEMTLKTQYNALIAVQRATLDKLHEGVAVFSGDGRLRLHNTAFSTMWHITAERLASCPGFDELVHMLEPLYADKTFWRDLKARITDPSPESRIAVEGELTRGDGTIVRYHSRPLPDGATLIAWVDVTDSRKIEQALRDRAAALEEADRLKSDFVGHVSYQLRSPLTTIMGYAELMEAGVGGPLSDKQSNQLSSIRAAADQLNKLIEDILDLATLGAGELELELGDVRLSEAIASAVNLATTKAEDTRVPIRIDCADDLPVIRGDEKRLKQVFYNLLSNALRHTHAGDEIVVGAQVRNGEAVFWVKDTGAGIDPDQQARVFETFTSGPRGGAGLGLSLVRSLIEAHGGWVEIQSAPGAGTTVTCHIPEKASAVKAAPELAF